MAVTPHQCQECENRISDRRKRFCTPACRQRFNNRRLQRGAELYDLFRALRRERSDAKDLNLWTEMCRLEKKWQEEDERERPGRRSYIEPKRALGILADKGSIPRGMVMIGFRA